jgi:quercetin dioxygenase-like cupin family protein
MPFQILPVMSGLLYGDDDIRVRAFHGGTLNLNTLGTLFFAVLEGRPVVNGHSLRAGMYGCLPQRATFDSAEDECRIMLCEAKFYRGMFCLGGPIEETGRLRYLNGCTDTGLIQPPKRGDPCLNALFFPAETTQTPHRHPSHRVGMIFDGSGFCHTGPDAATPMRQGDIFIIPANSLHWFTTHHEDMRIVVFHPDSDFGPSDEHHQMLEATLL